MPMYQYACDCGHRFEALVRQIDGPSPDCGLCGDTPRRVPSAVAHIGRADPGPSHADAPKSWRATNNGDRETVQHWHKQMTKRQKLEERNPELAGDRRPVLAHEGRFAEKPLRAGDPIPNTTLSNKSDND